MPEKSDGGASGRKSPEDSPRSILERDRARIQDAFSGRRQGSGRRRDDYDPRTTITTKLVVVTVVIVDALYLAGEALLFGQNFCP